VLLARLAECVSSVLARKAMEVIKTRADLPQNQ